ncbi:glycosyltransferase [Methanobrevibacter sp. TMH8]|nr:glycosyltransferase [Methanobrevibacter sp. TMH8]
MIDDGSTDSTQDIIKEYCEKYHNFKSIIQKNQGVANARNNALKIAKGEYIGFLDPDGDCFFEDALYNFNETINFHENKDNSPELVIGSQITTDTWSKVNFDSSSRNLKNTLRLVLNFRNKFNKINFLKKLSNNKFFKNLYYYKSAKFLPYENEIAPHDKRIIWTMLILNKMFKREKLLETGVKMPILTHASDAAFLFSFLYKCDIIVGCPHDVLIYKKRIFSDDSSLSQESNLDSVNAYYESYNIILESFKEYSNKYRQLLKNNNDNNELKNFESEFSEYIDLLQFKELQTLFINMTYRSFWKTDTDTLIRVKNILMEFKEEIIPETWEVIRNSNKDINIDDLVVDPIEMADNPLITIVLDNMGGKIDFILLRRIISNIYNSNFPAFELIISNELFRELDESFQSKENIHFIEYVHANDFKNKAINKSKGDYLFFIDQDILFSPNLLKEMFDRINGINSSVTTIKEKLSEVKSLGFSTKLIRNFPKIFINFIRLFISLFKRKSQKKYDFIICPMKPVIEDRMDKEDEYEIYKYSKRNLLDSNILSDCIISDKLISKEFLKRIKFEFSKDIKKDINIFYSLGEFQKINKNYILTTDEYLKKPLISIIIDNINLNEQEINDLLESIYNQEFKSFEIILNGDLKLKNNINHLNEDNIKFTNNNFKEESINISSSQYVLYIDSPINYKSNDFNKIFNKFKSNKIGMKDNINNKIIIKNKL